MLDTDLQEVAFHADALVEDDVYLGLSEWRRDFVFHDAHPHAIAGDFFSVLERFLSTHVETDA